MEQESSGRWSDEQAEAATQLDARVVLLEEELKRAYIVAKESQSAFNQLLENVCYLSDQVLLLTESINKGHVLVQSISNDRSTDRASVEKIQSQVNELRIRVAAWEASQIAVARHDMELLALRATTDQLTSAVNIIRSEAVSRTKLPQHCSEDARSVSVLQVRAIL